MYFQETALTLITFSLSSNNTLLTINFGHERDGTGYKKFFIQSHVLAFNEPAMVARKFNDRNWF